METASEAAETSARRLWGTEMEEWEESEDDVLSEDAAGSIFAKKYRKVLVISILMFVFQQMSGINSIVFFSR